MDGRQSEAWLRGRLEDLLEDGKGAGSGAALAAPRSDVAAGEALAAVRAAAAALVAAGVLAEARAESVAAEAACALALRGRAGTGELAARVSARPPVLSTKRVGPGDTVVVPFPAWATSNRGPVAVHAYLRTGSWGRLAGFTDAPETPSDAATVEIRHGATLQATTGGPVVFDRWTLWTFPLPATAHPAAATDGPPLPGDAAPTIGIADPRPPAGEEPPPESRSTEHLRLACGAALSSWLAGEDPRPRLAATIDALVAVADGALDRSLVAAARTLLAGNPGDAADGRMGGNPGDAGLLPSWRSVLDPVRPRRVARRLPQVGPARKATRSSPEITITITALIPGHHSFLVAAHVWPWNPTSGATRLNPGDNSRLLWWATDDGGRWYVGRAATMAQAHLERHAPPADFGADVAVVFRPPIDPSASHLTIHVQ